MITEWCLPRPEIVAEFLKSIRELKTLAELSSLGSANTLRDWAAEPHKMTAKTMGQITELARELNIPEIRQWQENVLADGSPVVVLEKEWHPPHTRYVAERSPDPPNHSHIVYAGELCVYMVNNKGVPQAKSLYNNDLYEMESKPRTRVIGRLAPIESEE